MPQSSLAELALQLEQQILATSDHQRAPLHARLHEVLREMRRTGQPVPPALTTLDNDLTEIEAEDQFDNMPV